MSRTTHPPVELRSIRKDYSGMPPVVALDKCSLRVDRGEHVAVMGRSGSGKSTLLNVVGLLDEPTSGEYVLDGLPTAQMGQAQRCALRAHRIGFVFQAFHLVSYRTAVENVETGLLYQRIPRSERRKQAVDALRRVGLGPRMWAKPQEMSGGERQRVAIARAVVRRPALVLCDEPTGNLDTTSGAQVLDLLGELHAEGMTIITITHDDAVAARAHRVILIEDGMIHATTRPPVGVASK